MYRVTLSTSDDGAANGAAVSCAGRACSGLPIGPEFPWLAPLAGFSDLPFRLLCREFGAAVACTEMVSAKGLILGQGKKSGATESYLATTPAPAVPDASFASVKPSLSAAPVLAAQAMQGPLPSDRVRAVPCDRPLVVQLFGSEAPFLERSVQTLAARGFRWFDLNMGCSVPKVGKSGSGSAMLRDIPNALAVARGMISAAGPGAVGFKLRLGWQAGEEVYLDLAQRLEDLGAGWITLHPRYARQKFTGTADWSHTARLKKALSIPVVAGGDIFTAHDALRCLEETGADAVMFARGALNNPAVFREYLDLLHGHRTFSVFRDKGALESVIRRHAALVREFMPPRLNSQGLEAGLLKMRTFVPRYVRRFSGARALRQALARCESWDGLDALLTEFFRDATVETESGVEPESGEWGGL